MYDLIIIGMGPSGKSAALYAKRSNLNTLILEKNSPGGLVNTTNKIDNYLGIPDVTGPELAYKMFKHVSEMNILFKIEEVNNVVKEKDLFKVTTNKSEYTTKSVIVSSGRSPKKTPFEEKVSTLKLSRCAICDAPLYKDKDVVVLGGGDSAVEESIYLSNISKSVKIISRSEIKGKLKSELESYSNIEVIENANIEDIKFDDDVYKLIVNGKEIIANGVFSYIGFTTSTGYLENLGVNMENGYIITSDGSTNIAGLYACGDIIKKSLYQIVTAVSEGAKCAVLANNYIRGLNK